MLRSRGRRALKALQTASYLTPCRFTPPTSTSPLSSSISSLPETLVRSDNVPYTWQRHNVPLPTTQMPFEALTDHSLRVRPSHLTGMMHMSSSTVAAPSSPPHLTYSSLFSQVTYRSLTHPLSQYSGVRHMSGTPQHPSTNEQKDTSSKDPLPRAQEELKVKSSAIEEKARGESKEGSATEEGEEKTSGDTTSKADPMAEDRWARWFRMSVRLGLIATGSWFALGVAALYLVPTPNENPSLNDRVLALLRAAGAYMMGVVPIHPALDTFTDDGRPRTHAPRSKAVGSLLENISKEDREALLAAGAGGTADVTAVLDVLSDPYGPRIIEHKPPEPWSVRLRNLPRRTVEGVRDFFVYGLRMLVLSFKLGPVITAYPFFRLVIWTGMQLGIGQDEEKDNDASESASSKSPTKKSSDPTAPTAVVIAEPLSVAETTRLGLVAGTEAASKGASPAGSVMCAITSAALAREKSEQQQQQQQYVARIEVDQDEDVKVVPKTVTSAPGLMAKTTDVKLPTWAIRLDDIWWMWLANSLESAGPTFVKLGQYASTREDIFSPRICAKLGRLREATRPHTWEDSSAALTETLGPHWEQYIHIDEADKRKPVGSGCIAQVYKGTVYVADQGVVPLEAVEGISQKNPSQTNGNTITGFLATAVARTARSVQALAKFAADHVEVVYSPTGDSETQTNIEDLIEITEDTPECVRHDPHPTSSGATSLPNDSGEYKAIPAGTPLRAVEVALKVLHPRAQMSVIKDIKLLTFLGEFAESLPFIHLHWVSPTEMMTEFSRLMLTQLDLTMEADNLIQFAKNFESDLDARRPFTVAFPEVILARPTLLVETFHRGLPIAVLLNSAFDATSTTAQQAALKDRERVRGQPIGIVSADSNQQQSQTTARLVTRDEMAADPSLSIEAVSQLASPAAVSARRLFRDKIPKNVSVPFLNHVLALDDDELARLKKDVAACGLDAFLRMLFEHGFFHADLHPGNIIVDLGTSVEKPHHHHLPTDCGREFKHENPTWVEDAIKYLPDALVGPASHAVRSCRRLMDKAEATFADTDDWELPSVFAALYPDDSRFHRSSRAYPRGRDLDARRIILIDAGMSTRLTARDRKNINDLFFYVASGQGELAAKMLIDRARQDRHAPPRTEEERQMFIQEVGSIVNQAAAVGFNLSSMSIVSTLTALLSAARNYRVKLDTSFISVVVAVTIIEGVGRSLDPDINVIAPALTILATARIKALKQKLLESTHDSGKLALTVASD